MRIVTLLPSATDIVCALGLADQLVGVSHSCRHPSLAASLPRVTGTRIDTRAGSEAIDRQVREHLGSNEALYDLDLERLAALEPDVVISQALCDVCAVATGDVDRAICTLPCAPSLIDLTPHTLGDVFDDIARVGDALGAAGAAQDLLAGLRERVGRVAERTATVAPADRPRVAFLEWLLPPFNGGHWNPELVSIAGGIDLFGTPGEPSATLDWSDVARSAPEVVFVACCGLPATRAMRDVALLARQDDWQSLPAVRSGRVYVTDGEAYFASPGPRLVDGLEIMAHALLPSVHPPPGGGRTAISS